MTPHAPKAKRPALAVAGEQTGKAFAAHATERQVAVCTHCVNVANNPGKNAADGVEAHTRIWAAICEAGYY